MYDPIGQVDRISRNDRSGSDIDENGRSQFEEDALSHELKIVRPVYPQRPNCLRNLVLLVEDVLLCQQGSHGHVRHSQGSYSMLVDATRTAIIKRILQHRLRKNLNTRDSDSKIILQRIWNVKKTWNASY